MSIPLVQNNEKDSINTSIIAIKKNLERINSILGLVDSGSDIDTSEFVKKSDIVDVVQSGNMNPVTSNAVVPVDTVTSGDMHSVTSNAVYNALSGYAPLSRGVYYRDFTPREINTPATLTQIIGNLYNQGYKFIVFGVTWDEYQSFSYAGASGYFILTNVSAKGVGFLRNYSDKNYIRSCRWVDAFETSRFTNWQAL